jgi:uncharacterized protein YecE (DUF72 family)
MGGPGRVNSVAVEPEVVAARERIAALGAKETLLRSGSGATIRFGIAGWTHRTMTAAGVFYPARCTSAEQRLRHYSSRFSLVEVDSAYYALPSAENSALWAGRTPPEFTFDVKAHALMTGHATDVARLPQGVRELLPAALASRRRLRAASLPAEVVDESWRLFAAGLQPLVDSGKLGSVLLQYPPWMDPTREHATAIAQGAARLREAGMRCAVELRNAGWFTGKIGSRTIEFLREHGIPFVVVDEPQGMENSVPPVLEATSPRLAVVRFHGQRAETWDVPNVTVEERFRYLYSGAELEPWAARIVSLAERARDVHVVFNNCYANYAAANALELAALVARSLPP